MSKPEWFKKGLKKLKGGFSKNTKKPHVFKLRTERDKGLNDKYKFQFIDQSKDNKVIKDLFIEYGSLARTAKLGLKTQIEKLNQITAAPDEDPKEENEKKNTFFYELKKNGETVYKSPLLTKNGHEIGEGFFTYMQREVEKSPDINLDDLTMPPIN